VVKLIYAGRKKRVLSIQYCQPAFVIEIIVTQKIFLSQIKIKKQKPSAGDTVSATRGLLK